MPRLRGFMGTNTSIFETQAKASLVCWSFWQGAETRDTRAEADPIGIHDGQKWVFFLPHGSLETHR